MSKKLNQGNLKIMINLIRLVKDLVKMIISRNRIKGASIKKSPKMKGESGVILRKMRMGRIKILVNNLHLTTSDLNLKIFLKLMKILGKIENKNTINNSETPVKMEIVKNLQTNNF